MVRSDLIVSLLLLLKGLVRIAFTGGTNVTLRGSTNPDWGWIDGHGQAVRAFQGDCLGQADAFQWWDAVNQDNRPHGIAFSKIAGGVIRDMKLWKVNELYRGSLRLKIVVAYSMELCHEWIQRCSCLQQ